MKLYYFYLDGILVINEKVTLSPLSIYINKQIDKMYFRYIKQFATIIYYHGRRKYINIINGYIPSNINRYIIL